MVKELWLRHHLGIELCRPLSIFLVRLDLTSYGSSVFAFGHHQILETEVDLQSRISVAVVDVCLILTLTEISLSIVDKIWAFRVADTDVPYDREQISKHIERRLT